MCSSISASNIHFWVKCSAGIVTDPGAARFSSGVVTANNERSNDECYEPRCSKKQEHRCISRANGAGIWQRRYCWIGCCRRYRRRCFCWGQTRRRWGGQGEHSQVVLCRCAVGNEYELGTLESSGLHHQSIGGWRQVDQFNSVASSHRSGEVRRGRSLGRRCGVQVPRCPFDIFAAWHEYVNTNHRFVGGLCW